MNAKDLERYKKLLVAKRDELLMAVDEAGGVMPRAGSDVGDLLDQARADAEADLRIRLRQSDADIVRAIDDALARIRRGTFGICEACKQPIAKTRLEAVPWAPLCRACGERESPGG
jgi:DnaK suppressor protein